MTDPRWQRLWQLFHEALDRPSAGRDDWLREKCADDEPLRLEVEELLASHGDMESCDFLEQPPELGAEAGEETPRAHADGMLGRTIGPYRLNAVIGEGGMGIVYDAQQESPVRRRVALKLIRTEMDSREAIERFESERQAIALMDHPHIARVLDAGTTEGGRPYFVMEYVAGVPITEYCDRQRVELKQRLELFIDVCQALQHAHQKGIIHRDLKPTNILVTVADGRPVPKVIDFGVAKAVHQSIRNEAVRTEFGRIIGTPEYMSPEQAEMSGLDVDTRTDIYAMGVLLYRLISGRLPFADVELRKMGYGEIQQTIREYEPPLPSAVVASAEGTTTAGLLRSEPGALARKLRGDLDWIVMRAMEKDRTRRYASAAELAADVHNHLTLQPVSAGPPSTSYRFRKFVARHKLMVSAGAIVGAALLVALGGISVGLVRAEDAREAAERERVRAEQTSAFLQEMLKGVQPKVAQGRDTTLLREILEEAAQRLDVELQSQPRVAGNLHLTLSDTFTQLGLYDRAEHHARSSWTLLRGEFGDRERAVVNARNTLGLCLWQAGRLQESDGHLHAALETARADFGDEDDLTLTLMNNAALVSKSLGNYEETEALHRQVLETRRRLLGTENNATLLSMNNLAKLLEERGELTEAEALMRTVVQTQRRTLGDRDPDTLLSMDVLGGILKAAGDLDGAEKLHREALAGLREVLGPAHPDTLGAQYYLARLFSERGDLDAAEASFVEILEVLESTLGIEHPYAVYTTYNLAVCVHRKEELSRAEGLFRRARELAVIVFPERNRTHANIDADYGALLLERGKLDLAEELLLAGYGSQREFLGETHPRALATAEWLTELYDRLDRPEQADLYRGLAVVNPGP